MKIRETFCFILISIIIITCETNDLPCCDNLGNRTFDIKIDFNKYYNEEIFPSEYLSAYDTWHLDYISGGFSGGGYVRDFDQLVIQKYGIFKIIRNDSLLVYGKIDINSQNPDNLFITLEADSVLGKVAFYDMAKYLYVSDSSLFLGAPCCDRYNYHFTTCNVYSDPKYYQSKSQLDNIDVKQFIVSQDESFKSVFFTDRNNGYILCEDNNVLKTMNAGESWYIYPTGCDLPLTEFYR